MILPVLATAAGAAGFVAAGAAVGAIVGAGTAGAVVGAGAAGAVVAAGAGAAGFAVGAAVGDAHAASMTLVAIAMAVVRVNWADSAVNISFFILNASFGQKSVHRDGWPVSKSTCLSAKTRFSPQPSSLYS